MIVYLLRDPRNFSVRYVGKTQRPMDVRFREHILRSSKKTDKDYLHVRRWIKALIALDLLPYVEIVSSCMSLEDLDEKEKRLIAHYKSIGCDLTNMTDGGDGWNAGYSRPPRSKSHRDALSKVNGGKPFWDQYGNYYESLSQCVQRLGISKGLISSTLNGKKNSTCGYRFYFEKPKAIELGPQPPLRKPRFKNLRKIVDQNGAIYNSQIDAARCLDIDVSDVWRVLNHKKKSTKGYVFKYLDEQSIEPQSLTLEISESIGA
jgi:hypothetical protein